MLLTLYNLVHDVMKYSLLPLRYNVSQQSVLEKPEWFDYATSTHLCATTFLSTVQTDQCKYEIKILR